MKTFARQIRQALGVAEMDGDREQERRQKVEARLAEPLAPAMASSDCPAGDDLVRRFADMLEEQAASVTFVPAGKSVVAQIGGFLKRHDLPLQVRCGSDALFEKSGLLQQDEIAVQCGTPRAGDLVSLTHAFAGAAETGTLFVASGPDNPVTLSFLPETNLVLVRKQDIVWSYEEAWQRLPGVGAHGPRAVDMPRTVNMISGPSRTADIEQTLIMGAHGPRRLHVLVISGVF